MKSYSPMRVSLFQMEITPVKRTVDCEINSWMETHKKRGEIRISKPVVPVKNNMRSSLNMLRQKRLQILKETAFHQNSRSIQSVTHYPLKIITNSVQDGHQSPKGKENILNAATIVASSIPSSYNKSMSTGGGSSAGTSSTNRDRLSQSIGITSLQKKQRLNVLAEVSEFSVENKKSVSFQTRKMLNSLMRGEFRGLDKLYVIKTKEKENAIIQTKITENQYKRFNFINRKLSRPN